MIISNWKAIPSSLTKQSTIIQTNTQANLTYSALCGVSPQKSQKKNPDTAKMYTWNHDKCPWSVRNDVIHKDLKIELIEDHVKNLLENLSVNFKTTKPLLINGQVEYAQ
ncbi:hypothetical protein AVEN_178868-1 [Araneus ventricosus]|uniref:Uncharacterized protein n=1 Tax=Araneus ventricosus TaxID=182803 RepID=A0A4Y2RMC8_ARAVE|nr:hypothetical protein AVEN_178868-1 [Araneus ventricosus]